MEKPVALIEVVELNGNYNLLKFQNKTIKWDYQILTKEIKPFSNYYKNLVVKSFKMSKSLYIEIYKVYQA